MTKQKKRKAREYYIAANNLNDEVMGCSARQQTLVIKPWYFMDYTIIKVREVLKRKKRS